MIPSHRGHDHRKLRPVQMLAGCSALALLAAMTPATAGVLERVLHDGVLRCGAEPRSGVAEDRGDGTLGGAAVDVCRAVAASVLGPHGRVAFRLYESSDDAGAGGDDLSFLTHDALAGQDRAHRLLRGPAVFTVHLALLVPWASAARAPGDLAGQAVCFMIGSDAQSALDAAFRARHLGFLHMGYEEEDEMADAYAAGRCTAMAGEATELARLGGADRSRLLAPPLAQFAVLAATPADGGALLALVRHDSR